MSDRFAKYRFDPVESYRCKEKREQLFYELCTHLSKGYTQQSFGRRRIVNTLLKEYAHEDWQEIVDNASAQGQKLIEGIGLDYLAGNIEGGKFFERSWQFVLAKRYKADWGEDTAKEQQINKSTVANIAEILQNLDAVEAQAISTNDNIHAVEHKDSDYQIIDRKDEKRGNPFAKKI